MNTLALSDPDANVSGLYNPAGTAIPSNATLSTILTGGGFNIFNLIFFIIGFIFFITLISASLSYVFAEGSPEKMAKANSQVITAIIGLTITLVSFVLVNLVLQIFGLGSISPFK